MISKWLRVVIMVVMVLIFSLTVVFTGCEPLDMDEMPQEPFPEEPVQDF